MSASGGKRSVILPTIKKITNEPSEFKPNTESDIKVETPQIKKNVLFERDGFILREETTYDEFFKKIKNEIIKEATSIRHDVQRCNLEGQNASLSIESNKGEISISCYNQDGTKDFIFFENLSKGSQKVVEILRKASEYGYNTSFEISQNNKYKLKPLYK